MTNPKYEPRVWLLRFACTTLDSNSSRWMLPLGHRQNTLSCAWDCIVILNQNFGRRQGTSKTLRLETSYRSSRFFCLRLLERGHLISVSVSSTAHGDCVLSSVFLLKTIHRVSNILPSHNPICGDSAVVGFGRSCTEIVMIILAKQIKGTACSREKGWIGIEKACLNFE